VNTLVAAALARAEFLSSLERFTVLEAAPDAERFSALDRGALAQLLGRTVRSPRWKPQQLLETAERDLTQLERRGIRLVPFDDPAYPPELREIYDPPLLLYVRGAPLTDTRTDTPEDARTDTPGATLVDRRARAGAGPVDRIAIVGTRRPSERAFAAAYRLARDAAAHGWVVVSGLAHGIDTAAHRGVIGADGATVAVLGCGIDIVYPYGNRALCRLLLERGGTVVSEYPPGLTPMAHRFPERNRIISGLSRAVIVAEAPLPSGALITAEYGLEQGREVLVHRDGLRGKSGAGTAALHGEGAPALAAAAELTRYGFVPASERSHPRSTPETDGSTPVSATGGTPPPEAPDGTMPAAAVDAAMHPAIGARMADELAQEIEKKSP
jgi:DNA processing protein